MPNQMYILYNAHSLSMRLKTAQLIYILYSPISPEYIQYQYQWTHILQLLAVYDNNTNVFITKLTKITRFTRYVTFTRIIRLPDSPDLSNSPENQHLQESPESPVSSDSPELAISPDSSEFKDSPD